MSVAVVTNKLKPVLRYPGGKARIASWIVNHLPPHEVYLEPFFGAGSVLFAKDRCSVELINDLDDRVVTLFRVLRDRPDELIRAIELTPYARTEYEAATGAVDDELEQARRFLIQVWMGHAGKIGHKSGFRVGFFGGNVPGWGAIARPWAALPDRLRAATDRLSGVMIECRPALRVIDDWARPGVVIYADPPYLPPSGGNWKSHYRHVMSQEDHVQLLAALDRHPGPVLLSGYRSDIYDELLEHWSRIDRKSRGYRAVERIESLWLNPVAAATARQRSLHL
jgi:DNA adenine methylase